METTIKNDSFDSATFRVFYTCLGFLLLKMMFMVVLTARMRYLKKVVISPEDTALRKGLKVKYDDPDVERIRRAHLNDLESIIIFINVAFMYLYLSPSPVIAIPLVILYAVTRYVHTYVYAVAVKPQPARFLSFAVGHLITIYMAGYVVLSLKGAM